MTEESYQQGRKFMRSVNYVRGLITEAKANVGKWTKLEDHHRRLLQQSQAEGAHKKLQTAIKKLEELRQRFAEMKFPDSNIGAIQVESSQCESCGARIAKGNTYCGECLCEDDGI